MIKGYHWGYLALLLVLMRILLTLGWEIWPYEVIKFNRPIRILTEHVVPNGELIYEMDYCKSERFKDTHATVTHSFVNHLVHNAPTTLSQLAAGCHVVIFGLPMPLLPPGEYQLEMVRTYRVNPIRTVTVKSITAPFMVNDH